MTGKVVKKTKTKQSRVKSVNTVFGSVGGTDSSKNSRAPDLDTEDYLRWYFLGEHD